MITQEQRESRIIGASDAAALLGVSRYKTRRQLYEELVGNIERDDVSNETRVRIGNALEQLILDMHDEQMKIKSVKSPPTFTLEAQPWLTVHLDAIYVDATDGTRINVEAKKVGHNMRQWWGEAGTDRIDPEYLPQVHMQMWAAKCDRTHVAALIGDDDFRVYFVERDPEMDVLIAQVGNWFWRQVQQRRPPPLDHDHSTTLPLLKQMYPGTDGSTIECIDVEHWDAVMQDAMEKAKQYQSVVDGAKAHILEMMGTAAIGRMTNGYEFVRRKITVPERHQDGYEFMKMTRRKTRQKEGE